MFLLKYNIYNFVKTKDNRRLSNRRIIFHFFYRMPSYTLEELSSSIKTSPIYLASVHGSYELRKGQQSYATEFTVPPNCWILEAATAGDVTSTEIDELLWNFLQNRREFITYLFKQKGATDPAKKKVVNSLTIYAPGEKIYSRVFSLAEAEKDDWGWGYYKIPGVGFDEYIEFPGNYEYEIPKETKNRYFPVAIPDPPLTHLMRKLRNRHYYKDNGDEREEYDYTNYNTKRFVDEILSEEAPEQALFVISACASLWGKNGGSRFKTRLQKRNTKKNTVGQDSLIKRIELTQRAAQLQQAELGIASSITLGNLLGQKETYTEAMSNENIEEGALRRVNQEILEANEKRGTRAAPIGRATPPKNTFLLFLKTPYGSFKPIGGSGFKNVANTEWDMAWTDELFMEKIGSKEKDWGKKYFYEAFVPVNGMLQSEILPMKNKGLNTKRLTRKL